MDVERKQAIAGLEFFFFRGLSSLFSLLCFTPISQHRTNPTISTFSFTPARSVTIKGIQKELEKDEKEEQQHEEEASRYLPLLSNDKPIWHGCRGLRPTGVLTTSQELDPPNFPLPSSRFLLCFRTLPFHRSLSFSFLSVNWSFSVFLFLFPSRASHLSLSPQL